MKGKGEIFWKMSTTILQPLLHNLWYFTEFQKRNWNKGIQLKFIHIFLQSEIFVFPLGFFLCMPLLDSHIFTWIRFSSSNVLLNNFDIKCFSVKLLLFHSIRFISRWKHCSFDLQKKMPRKKRTLLLYLEGEPQGKIMHNIYFKWSERNHSSFLFKIVRGY